MRGPSSSSAGIVAGRSLSADYLKRSQRILRSSSIDDDGLIEPPEEDILGKNSSCHTSLNRQLFSKRVIPKKNIHIDASSSTTRTTIEKKLSKDSNFNSLKDLHDKSGSASSGSISIQARRIENGSNVQNLSTPLSRPIPPNIKSSVNSNYSLPSQHVPINQNVTSSSQFITSSTDQKIRKISPNYPSKISETISSPIEQIQTKSSSPISSPILHENTNASLEKGNISHYQTENNHEYTSNSGKRLKVHEILLHSHTPAEEDIDIEVDISSLLPSVDKFYKNLQNYANHRIEKFKKRLEVAHTASYH